MSFIGDPKARVDPYPFYRAIRERSPVVRSTDGTWWAFDFASCMTLARDKRWSHVNPAGVGAGGCSMGSARVMVNQMILFRDPPDHTRLRGLLGRLFTMPAAESKRAEFRAHIEVVLSDAAWRGEVDFKEEIARLIPMFMICDLIGLPQGRYADLIRWSDSYASMLAFDVTPEMEQAANREFAEFTDYLHPVIEARHARPEDDLISSWLQSVAAGRMAAHEIPSYALFTLVGGQSTTTTTMTNALYTFKRHPDQWALLCAHPDDLKKGAADEVLRFESAGRALVPRWATELTTLGGQTIAQGDMVIAVEIADNREPAVCEDPDRFDIGRKRNPHMAFGGGIHICPGQFVARVEIQELLGTLAAHFPQLRTGEPRAWLDDWILRGLTDLPVELNPDGKCTRPGSVEAAA